MLVRIMSDLHLEFYEENNIKFELEHDLDFDTVLLLAGDIHVGTKAQPYIKEWADRFKHVVYLAGNHEFYHHELNDVVTRWRNIEDTIENFTFLNNSSVEVEDTIFVGGTLWTNFDNKNPMSMINAQRNMNDFYIISYDQGRFTPDIGYALHQDMIKTIGNTCLENKNTDKKVVVATHHAPSFRSISARYVGDKLNGAYASPLDEKISDWQPALWVHGHVHNSFDYMIDNTRVVCNPGGYQKYALNSGFDPKLVIEI